MFSPNATHFLHLCCQGPSFSLLGRLEGLGAGAAAAQGRRSQAAQQENLWRRQRQVRALCVRQGRDILRRSWITFSQFHYTSCRSSFSLSLSMNSVPKKIFFIYHKQTFVCQTCIVRVIRIFCEHDVKWSPETLRVY